MRYQQPKNRLKMKKLIQKTLILIVLSLPQTILFANNVQISNVKITGQDTASKFTMVQFDISWENSWRTSTLEKNWDAAWIFVKYRKKRETIWNHAYLNDSGHEAPTGSEITPGFVVTNAGFDATTNPAVGVFLYRSGDGIGNINYEGVQLRWNYSVSVNGVNGLADNDSVEVSVFAIEMVYIPTGSFYAGDGIHEGSNSVGRFVAGTTTEPFQITSEAALTIGDSATTQLWGTSTGGSSTIGNAGELPANFPKGYQSFYIMKYELSQYMYKEYLNKLTRTQQIARSGMNAVGRFMPNSTSSQNRNGIRIMSSLGSSLPFVYGNDLNNNGIEGEPEDGLHIACNWLSFYDLMAFADWSGLRPYTELEFEKACRGTLPPVINECAWGTSNITNATTITNYGMENERANAGANIVTNNKTNGPMRCGCFANDTTNREQAGATFYGVMEMSGNLWEYTYSVGRDDSRNFNGNIHGDGIINKDNGFTDIDETDWPRGVSFRGSSWYDTSNAQQTSSRNHASSQYTYGRYSTTGIRLARTQP